MPTTTAPACGLAPGQGELTASDRAFRVDVPAGPGPFPVIVQLHGFSSNATEQAFYSGLVVDGPARGYVVITPDGLGTPQRWDLIGAGDFAFVDAAIDALPAGCADPARTYVTGISNGSAFSAFATCRMAHPVAAIALVATTLYPNACSPRPTPVLAFHGTADPVVPYAGGTVGSAGTFAGAKVAPAEEAMGRWAALDGCAASPTVTSVAADVTELTWPGCTAGEAVVLERIEGGGHTWPGAIAVPRLGATTASISATRQMLDFFDAHPG